MKRADFAAELARRRAEAGLSLAALAARAHIRRPDEAAHCGVLAIESDQLVPSNFGCPGI